MPDLSAWRAPQPALETRLDELQASVLEVFRADPLLIDEYRRQEDSFRTGGYADRQIYELVQNAADALARGGGTRGRVELHITNDALYCANAGQAFTRAGLDAVCHAYLSDKRGDEIGRFGLGFKSVLGVTSRPTIFSTSISFGFDGQRAREELSAIAPESTSFPVLRMPFAIDTARELETDSILANLASWASTIVRLPLSNVPDALLADLYRFPREFLLFARSVDELRIVISGRLGSKVLEYTCVERGDNLITLKGGERHDEDWLVVERTHKPSADALAEVGETLRRDEIRLTYAVPLDDPSVLGQFWAHFPLQDLTSTRGIHNAPWRINDDRTNLLDGRFNQEILDLLGDLVVENLHRLSAPDDPARHFDYLPARGREAPNKSDRYLAETIPPKARQTRCIPDAEGRLRRPDELIYLRSDVELNLEAYGRWDSAPGRPTESPHWTCYKNRDRRARLRGLLRVDDEQADEREVNPAEWIERIAGSGTDDTVEAALAVIFTVKDENHRRAMLGARILPDSDGELHRLTATNDLFLRGNVLSAAAGLRLLRPSLLERDEVVARLGSLQFRDVDPGEELRKLATTAARNWSSEEWSGFWSLVEEVNSSEAQKILVDHVASGARLKVRCLDRLWHDIGEAVVRGVVEPTNAGFIVDDDYHELHLGLLKAIGIAARPVASPALERDSTFMEYQRLHRDAFLRQLPPRGRPTAAAIMFEEHGPFGPLHVLRRFADTGDLAAVEGWTSELLALDTFDQWHLVNTSTRSAERHPVTAPHLWAAQRYGRLKTSWGTRPPLHCLAAALDAYSSFLPVASDPRSTALKTISSLDQIPTDVWREFLDRPATGTDPFMLGDLLLRASDKVPADDEYDLLPGVGGDSGIVTATRLLVALNDEEVRALSARLLPHIALRSDQDAARLIRRWGCALASTVLRVDIVTESPGEPVVLLDRFRGLRAVSGGRLEGCELVFCTDLARQVTGPDGVDSEPAEYVRTGSTIYYLGTVTDEALLGYVAADFEIELSSTTLQRMLSDAQSAQINEKLAACRALTSVPEKLLAMLPATVLESALPSGLLDSVRRLGEDAGPPQVAELLLHVHGYSVLTELKHPLDSAGYPVPERWAGSSPAVAFVRQLGLPREYAGVRGASLDADLTVLGPPNLEPLHKYQRKLARQIRELVAESSEPQRALLFLPTGAGKTRVTVEALVKAFIEDGLLGPLLWIAQSEELCEQAVQTWNLVWREFGDRPLRVCRLWNTNEIANSEETLTVVVATDAKLDKCRNREEYDWLRDSSAVVIDEAHTASEGGIDATLRWLGIGPRETARPLLGLTATPFKGTGEEANRRLANRFGRKQLNVLGDDPYGELQRMDVLACIDHHVLDGASVELAVDEIEQVRTFGILPPAVLERVGRDEERTRRLLDHIVELPSDWPVLVFTASVLSAQVLAALLRVRGVEAASVSGATRMYDRRRSIDAFRRGEIQVLTNCNVLTQGFDAPAVRALYIARPTFSPNAYIQMVGRGLRGPANGGKSECLVVNIADTFGQFGDKLAYKEFEYLWTNNRADS